METGKPRSPGSVLKVSQISSNRLDTILNLAPSSYSWTLFQIIASH